MYQSTVHCRYDKLLSAVKSSGRGAPPPGMCVVGMSVMGEEVMRGVFGEYEKGQVTGCCHVVVSKCSNRMDSVDYCGTSLRRKCSDYGSD